MEKEIFKVYADTRRFANDGHSFNGALWEVSNCGNVRKNGDIYIPFDKGNGYLCFGGCANYYVHRAVAELFINNNNTDLSVDHINQDKHDNRVCNLRWVTRLEQNMNRDWETIKPKIGKYASNAVWIIHPMTNDRKRVPKEQLTDYLAKGYIRVEK